MNEEEICKNCKYHYMEEISFDYPQSCCNKTNPNHTTEECLHCDCFEYSKNYITNLQQKVEQLEKENKRLNNIINELEEYIKFEIPEEEFVNSEWYVNILDKLKELKESNNDKK